MAWVLIAGSRLDARTFGEVSAVTAVALVTGGVVRAQLSEQLLLSSTGLPSLRRGVVTLTAVTAAGLVAASVVVAERPSTMLWLAVALAIYATYEAQRYLHVAAEQYETLALIEVLRTPMLLAAAALVPSGRSNAAPYAAALIATAGVSLLFLRRGVLAVRQRQGESSADVQLSMSYTLDFMLAGGAFQILLLALATLGAAEEAGFLRYSQAVAGPISTAMIAAWLGFQHLARSAVHGNRDSMGAIWRMQVLLLAGGGCYAAAVLAAAGLGAPLLAGVPIGALAAIVVSRVIEAGSVGPALLLRHLRRERSIVRLRTVAFFFVAIVTPAATTALGAAWGRGALTAGYAIVTGLWLATSRRWLRKSTIDFGASRTVMRRGFVRHALAKPASAKNAVEE